MRAYPRGETLVFVRRVPLRVAGELQYDVYGVLIYTEQRVTVRGCVVWPSTATEVPQDQERTSTTYTVAVPDGVEVDAVDRIIFRGKSYEVRGELEMNTNPASGTRCNTFAMFRVEG